MNHYKDIKILVGDRLKDEALISESEGVLEVVIPVGSKAVKLKIQGADTPEIDITFEKVKRYFSAGDPAGLTKYIDSLIDDVMVLRDHADEIEIKRNRILGIIGLSWKVVYPSNLAILG